jgi:transcriptional regulator with XRE-family HTH domain
MDAVAMAAGISRVTLYRVEKGEGSVTWGAVWRVAAALGAQLSPTTPQTTAFPEKLRLSDYPVLLRLGWQLAPDTELSPAEAWSLLSREWRHVDPSKLTKVDSGLIEYLEETFGAIPRFSPPPPSANRRPSQRPER